jgi:hypothetical protein
MLFRLLCCWCWCCYCLRVTVGCLLTTQTSDHHRWDCTAATSSFAAQPLSPDIRPDDNLAYWSIMYLSLMYRCLIQERLGSST